MQRKAEKLGVSASKSYKEGYLAALVLKNLLRDEKVAYKGSYLHDEFVFHYSSEIQDILPWKGVIELSNYKIKLTPSLLGSGELEIHVISSSEKELSEVAAELYKKN